MLLDRVGKDLLFCGSVCCVSRKRRYEWGQVNGWDRIKGGVKVGRLRVVVI